MHLKAFWNEEVRGFPAPLSMGSFKIAGFDSGLREKLAGGQPPGQGELVVERLQQREDWQVARCL